MIGHFFHPRIYKIKLRTRVRIHAEICRPSCKLADYAAKQIAHASVVHLCEGVFCGVRRGLGCQLQCYEGTAVTPMQRPCTIWKEFVQGAGDSSSSLQGKTQWDLQRPPANASRWDAQLTIRT